MILKELLEEIKIGTEEFNDIKTVNELTKSFSEDDNKYKTYKVIENSLTKIFDNKNDLNEEVIKYLSRINSRIKEIERKDKPSDSFKRMKLDSLAEDYNKVMSIIESKKILNSLNKRDLSKIMAVSLYNIDKLIMETNTEDFKKLNETPEEIKPYFDKQLNLVINTLM